MKQPRELTGSIGSSEADRFNLLGSVDVVRKADTGCSPNEDEQQSSQMDGVVDAEFQSQASRSSALLSRTNEASEQRQNKFGLLMPELIYAGSEMGSSNVFTLTTNR